MSTRNSILRALHSGDKTNAELQELCETDGVDIARTCWELIRRGHVIRVDKGGRGARATYGLSQTTKIVLPQRRNTQEIENAVIDLLDRGYGAAAIARELSISIGWAKSLIGYLGTSKGAEAGHSDKAIAAQTAALIAAIRRHHPERCL